MVSVLLPGELAGHAFSSPTNLKRAVHHRLRRLQVRVHPERITFVSASAFSTARLSCGSSNPLGRASHRRTPSSQTPTA